MNREPNTHDNRDGAPSSAMRRHARHDHDMTPDQSYENPSNAGMIGFILCMVSLGLLVVVAVLWFAMNAEDEQLQIPERRRMMLYWFMILDIVSFFVALAATIFASRGVSPTNPLYRGWGWTALFLGILEIVLTALAALVLSCFVLIAEVNRAGG